MPEVIVAGAGFAGLAAATELRQAGIEVVVIEARERVGGRVWSQMLEAPDGTASVIERGGEFVLDGYEELRALASQHRLSIVDTGMSYYVREPRGALGVDAVALQRAGSAVARAVRAASTPDACSVADVIAAAGLPVPLAEAVLARVEISCALGAERLSCAVLDHAASFERLPSHRVAGGNQGLASCMADALGTDGVKLNAAVRAIDCQDDRIRVIVDGGELEADQVLLALPLPVVRDLPIDPPLPPWKRDALERVEIGQAAKLHLPLAAPATTSAVMSVPDRFWCWTATAEDGLVAPVLNCFAGSPEALRRLAVANGPSTWAQVVDELRPDLAMMTPAAVLTTWRDDPFARGAYRVDGLRAQAVDDARLEAPVGRLHFAGEYAAGQWSGLMEGALRSGRRAAAELRAAMR